MRTIRINSRLATAGAVIALAALWSTTVSAQLDPLLFLKRVPPTVVVAFDTSFAMLEDADGNYYDPNVYKVADDPAVAAAFGLDTALQTSYRRRYVGLMYDTVQDASRKWEATDIIAVADNSPDYATFFDKTRYEVARQGVLQAVNENAGNVFRWGLVKQRQDGASWRTAPNCDKPVRVTGNAALGATADSSPCNAGGSGRYGIYATSVNNPNYSLEGSPAPGNPVVVAAGGNTASSVATKLVPFSTSLIPASRGERGYRDRPLTHLLEDAKAEVVRAMTADAASTRSCRNSIVVLVVSGPESGNATYAGSHNAATTASSFASVTAGGFTKRVPIFVVAVKPLAADEAGLQQIATNSGGVYFKATTKAEVTKAVNSAVQAGFNRSGDFDQSQASEFSAVSPIIGTVNLANASDVSGSPLPNTTVTMTDPQNASNVIPIPQRSNVLLTAGFALPGFEGRIRAFRTFRPESDPSKPSKYKFVADGTRLWPDLDGRPQWAGLARIPADPSRRNIYTAVPGADGSATVTAFSSANAASLAGPMNLSTSAASTTIDTIRALPIGAIVGSTPAIMDAPSLDPPPDDQYGRAGTANTFAGTYEDRRSIIFVGANDGMIHAIDARTGYEVWAFIPYNLLPKLKTLLDGQPIEQFDYFVDSSPKIAEVKMNTASGHQWRSMLIVGQGPGGTFYQAFDVTEAGMGVSPSADGMTAVDAMLLQFDAPNESIVFKWAFPNYNSFDPSYYGVLGVSDATPGGKVRMFGDLKSAASTPEKTVGFTWSDPAVGPLDVGRAVNAVMVGSGYFPNIEDLLPGRISGPRAGRSFYLLKIEDGTLLGSPVSCGSANGSIGCLDVGASTGGQMKNALQADPSAAGNSGSPVVNKAYIGDLSGKYWKFTFGSNGALTKTQMVDTGQPIFSSSALLFVGTTNVYMFFSTGSDLLPTTSAQGTGRFKLWALQDNAPGAGATTKFTRDMAAVTDVAGVANGERASTAPSVAGDIVFFTTTTETASTPCGDMTANLYGFTYLGGAAYDSASSGNNRLDTNESPLIRSVSGRATAPFIVDQHLYFSASGGTASGSTDPNKRGLTLEMFGDPEDFNNGVGQVGIRILSWREIR